MSKHARSEERRPLVDLLYTYVGLSFDSKLLSYELELQLASLGLRQLDAESPSLGELRTRVDEEKSRVHKMISFMPLATALDWLSGVGEGAFEVLPACYQAGEEVMDMLGVLQKHHRTLTPDAPLFEEIKQRWDEFVGN